MRYPTRFQQKTLWNAATGVSILVLGALVVSLIWLIGYVFGFLQPVLVPLVVAGIIAYVVEPVVTFLETRGMSRLWAVITLFLAILAATTLLVAAILPGVQKGQGAFREFISSSTPSGKPSSETASPDTLSADGGVLSEGETAANNPTHLIPTLVSLLEDLRLKHRSGLIGWALTEVDERGEPALTGQSATLDSFTHSRAGRVFSDNTDVIFKTGRSWLTAGSTKVLGILGLVIGMIMVPVYLFFFLKDSAAIRLHWHDYVPLRASRFKSSLVGTLQEINGYLISFFRGQVLVAAIDGILVGIALTIFGLPYGLLIGVFMAILGVIPYIGNIICLIPACIIAYLHAQATAPFGLSAFTYVACVVAIFVVVQQINSLVTAPKIVGDSVGLHPLTVIFSMLFWSLVLGGFVGALLAVPLTAAVKVLFRRFIWERQLRDYPGPELETGEEIW
jgi:predicted PurR-regulated permease PerM